MNVRARSLSQQWTRWLVAALVALVAYLLFSVLFCGTVTLNVLQPRAHRLALPIFLALACIAWELRWDGVVRKEEGKPKGEDHNIRISTGGIRIPTGGPRSVAAADGTEPVPPDAADGTRIPTGGPRSVAAADGTEPVPPEAADGTEPVPPDAADGTEPVPPDDGHGRDAAPGGDSSGEALYVRARAIPHGPIPDYVNDGRYLALLGKSAAKGHAPALAKLGAYAMRRAAWVEAYYWIAQARRCGAPDCAPLLQTIRRSWINAGFPDEAGNVHRLFPEAAGSVGRALLHVDSGQGAAVAREFLKAHHPEFLPSPSVADPARTLI